MTLHPGRQQLTWTPWPPGTTRHGPRATPCRSPKTACCRSIDTASSSRYAAGRLRQHVCLSTPPVYTVLTCAGAGSQQQQQPSRSSTGALPAPGHAAALAHRRLPRGHAPPAGARAALGCHEAAARAARHPGRQSGHRTGGRCRGSRCWGGGGRRPRRTARYRVKPDCGGCFRKPPPPSTPSKGTHKEPVVLVMACGYAWCALGGHFPLAGTYFQHNEVFLDTCSVLHHIQVRTVVWEQQRGCLCTCMCQQVVDLHAMCRYPPRCGGRPRQPAPASRWCLAPTRATCAEA